MSNPLRILHGPFGRLALVRLTKPMTVHAHRVCHIIFKIGGEEIAFGVRKREHLLTDKNVLLVNAWEPHWYHHYGEAHATVLLALYIDPDWFRRIDQKFAFSVHPRFFCKASIALTPVLESIKNDLLDLLTDKNIPSGRYLEDLLLRALVDIGSTVNRRNEMHPAELAGGAACDARIRHALDLMKSDEGLTTPLSEIAYTVGLSRPHFHSLFFKSTRMTPAVFSSMLKMDAALRKLAQSRVSLSDIGRDIGFGSQSNFTRFFLHQQGVTPSQYRKVVEIVSK